MANIETIASQIKDARRHHWYPAGITKKCEAAYAAGIDTVARHIAAQLAVENPGFNQKEFLTACGVVP